jgi:hypothetical protein
VGSRSRPQGGGDGGTGLGVRGEDGRAGDVQTVSGGAELDV